MVSFQTLSELDVFIKSNPGLSTAQKVSNTIGGNSGYKLTYQIQTAAAGTASVSEYIYQGMVIHNRALYTITLSSWNQKILNQNSVLFDQILSTFKFL